MMDTGTHPLVWAVLNNDCAGAELQLQAGASPDMMWVIPLITHAARMPNLAMFRLLRRYGAEVPEDILRALITWELADWWIAEAGDEARYVEMLNEIRTTKAWLSDEERRDLIPRLATDYLLEIKEVLRLPGLGG